MRKTCGEVVMKKGRVAVWCLAVLAVLLVSSAGYAEERKFRIEVLQVTDIGPFQASLTGFVSELQKNGLVQGKNLEIRRTVIDFDVEKAGLWSKVGVLLRITGEAQKIADRKPDLVLTIGTPATKYAKDRIIKAGIPLVFTGVAVPTAAGCRSLREAGPGFTGATLYMDMDNVVKIIRLAFPAIKTLGVVHSEDENAVAQVDLLKKSAAAAGMKVMSRLIDKNARITPVAEEMNKEGIDAFVIPLDTYYGMRNYEATNDIRNLNLKWKKPGICLVYWKSPGAVLYIGSDFKHVGALSGSQAAKILLEGARPETLPVLHQEELGIMVDTGEMKKLNVQLPLQILQVAKPLN